jgi:cytochrome P450
MRSEVPVAPGRVPVLGHLPALARKPLQFVRSATDYAPVVRVYLARSPAYLVTQAALVRDVLVSSAGYFDKGVQYEKLAALLGNSISTTSGTEHRDRRRGMQPAFHHERIAHYETLMRDAATEMAEGWRPGQIVAVDEAMRTLALTIVARALCSTDPGIDAVATIRRDLPQVLRGVAWRVLLSSPFVESLPLPASRRFAAANQRLRTVVAELVAHRRTVGEPGDDLLSLLMFGGQSLDDDRIRDEVVNILFAGTETTGNAMGWMFAMLGARPELARRLENGDRDLAGRVARETLRCYPPPWLVSRRARESVHIGPYELPAGAQVLFSPYAIQRDPANYPDPDTIDPDRWTTRRSGESPRYAFLPFGAGAQNCVGEGFAMLEMTTVATTIAARWRLTPVGTTREKASATLMPSQVRMRVTPVS